MASEHDIIVVDDHPLFRRGVIQLLKMDPSFNVVAEAGDFEAAMVAVRERDPDIVLLDLNMKTHERRGDPNGNHHAHGFGLSFRPAPMLPKRRRRLPAQRSGAGTDS